MPEGAVSLCVCVCMCVCVYVCMCVYRRVYVCMFFFWGGGSLIMLYANQLHSLTCTVAVIQGQVNLGYGILLVTVFTSQLHCNVFSQ